MVVATPRVSRPFEGWEELDEESVVVVEVCKKGAPLPILETSILTDRMNRRTRGGKNRVRGAGRRDQAFDRCSKWLNIIVMDTNDDILTTENIGRYQVVKTSTSFEVINISRNLPPITASGGKIATLPAALSVLAACLLKSPLKHLSSPPPLYFPGTTQPPTNGSHFLFNICVKLNVSGSSLFSPTYPTAGVLPSPPTVVVSFASEKEEKTSASIPNLTIEVPLSADQVVQYFTFLNSFGRMYDLILESLPKENLRFDSFLQKFESPEVGTGRQYFDNKKGISSLDSLNGIVNIETQEVDITLCGQVGYYRTTGSIAFLTLLLLDVGRKLNVVVPADVHKISPIAAMLKMLSAGDFVILKSPKIGINPSTGAVTMYATSNNITRAAPISDMLPTVDVGGEFDVGIIKCYKPFGVTACPHSSIRDNEHPTAQHLLEKQLSDAETRQMDEERMKKLKLYPISITVPRSCSGVQLFTEQQDLTVDNQLDSTAIMLCSTIDGEHKDLTVIARFEFCYLAILKNVTKNSLFLSPNFVEAMNQYKVVNGTSSGGSGVHKIFVKRYGVKRVMIHIIQNKVGVETQQEMLSSLPSDFLRVLQSLSLTWRSPLLVPKGFFYQSQDVITSLSAITFLRTKSTLPSEIATLPEEIINWIQSSKATDDVVLSKDRLHIISLKDDGSDSQSPPVGESQKCLMYFLKEVIDCSEIADSEQSKWKVFKIPDNVDEFNNQPIVKDLILKGVFRLTNKSTELLVMSVQEAITNAVAECPSTEKSLNGGVPLSWLARRILPWVNILLSEKIEQQEGKINKWVAATNGVVQIISSMISKTEQPQKVKWIRQGVCTEILHQSGCCCQYQVSLVTENKKSSKQIKQSIASILETKTESSDCYLLLMRESGRTHPLVSLELRLALDLQNWKESLTFITNGLYLFDRSKEPSVELISNLSFKFKPTALRRILRIWSPSVDEFISKLKQQNNITNYITSHEVSESFSQELLPFVSLHRIQKVVAVFQTSLGPEYEPAEGVDLDDDVTRFCVLHLPNNETIYCEDIIPSEYIKWNNKIADFITKWELKPFSFSGSMEPAVAITIANVAIGTTRELLKIPNDVCLDVVDGCCGSGTLSAAAAVLKCQVYSSELRADFASKTASNFEHLSVQESISLNIQDATKPYPANVRSGCQLLLCNPPWGVRFGSSCDSIPIVSALTRSFPNAIWCFVAPKIANDSLLSSKKPLIEKLFRIQFGCVEILLARVFPSEKLISESSL